MPRAVTSSSWFKTRSARSASSGRSVILSVRFVSRLSRRTKFISENYFMPGESGALLEGLILAKDGSGPLLQRDYWAVVKGCPLSPAQVGELLAERFCELAPPDLQVVSR